jgi:hypothetical protein
MQTRDCSTCDKLECAFSEYGNCFHRFRFLVFKLMLLQLLHETKINHGNLREKRKSTATFRLLAGNNNSLSKRVFMNDLLLAE